MDKVRVGIIGTGFTIGIARNHVKAYEQIPEAELTAIYDVVPGRGEAFLKKNGYEGIRVCNSLEEFLSQVDAVSICAPNHEHVNLAVTAMEAEKHVIVEKPFSLDYEDGKRALEAAQKHPELVAMTVFNYREQKEVQMMKRIIDSGKLGRIISVRHINGGGRMWDAENVFLEWRMQRKTSGTGSMADFGVHMLDLTDYLLHEHIGNYVAFDAITSTLIKERYHIDPQDTMGGRLGDGKGRVTNDDVAAFSAVTESGTLVSFETGRLVWGLSMMEIAGDQGVVARCNAYPDGTLGFYCRSDEHGTGKLEPIKIDQDLIEGPAHAGVLKEFIHCIRTGEKPVRDFRHGVYIQKLIDLFDQAAQTGQTVYETVDENML